MNERDDEYLWSGEGTPDPEVERLERLLRPTGLDPAATPPAAPRPVELSRTGFRWMPLTAAALLVVALGVRFFHDPRGGSVLDSGPRLVVTATGEELAPDSTFVADERRRSLELGDVGWLDFQPGSRLRVGRLDADEVVLALDEGTLDALVSADAAPGFFNVDTPAARCVDLGCAYTLTVDDAGDAHVVVRTGRVAFRDGEREVYVPAGAACAATRAGGASTPLYLEGTSPALALAAAELDAARSGDDETRRRLAETLVAASEGDEGELPVWHLLQDDDPGIVALALERLRASERSDGSAPRRQPRGDDPAAWREYLWPDPYR